MTELELLRLGELALSGSSSSPTSSPADSPPQVDLPAEGSEAAKMGGVMLLGGVLGAALGNIIPDPGDIVYIVGQKHLTKEYRAGRVSNKQLWVGELALYYLPSFTWWTFVSLLTYKAPGLRPKVAMAGGLVASGAVVALLVKYLTEK